MKDAKKIGKIARILIFSQPLSLRRVWLLGAIFHPFSNVIIFMKDSILSIRKHSYRFFSGTLLSRISGMLRDISMAYIFGTQPSIAAFMVAFRFAHLFRRLFGEGALQSAFIPEFEALRQVSEKKAMTFFRDLHHVLTIFLILLVSLGGGILGIILYLGNLTSSNQEILYLTLLMLPSLLFICLYGLNSSFLQCEKFFFIPSVAPVAFNGIWILTIFCVKIFPIEKAVIWLAFGVVIACFCQWFLTVPQTRRSLKQTVFPSFWGSFNHSTDLYRLMKPLFLGVIGVAASQINNAIDSIFARYAEADGPAFLWYSIRIQQLPLALFGIAIAGAVLPPLSRAFKSQQYQQYQQFLEDALYRTWNFMFPMTAALIVLGDISVAFLYGRGDFEAQSIIKTTYCLWAYGIGLLPSALVLVLAPAFYAQNNYKIPAIASLMTMLINLCLNSFFIVYCGWGASSVALATSISAWINLLWIGFLLPETKKPSVLELLRKKCLFVNLATVLAFTGTYQWRVHLQQTPFFSHSILFSTSLGHQFITFTQQIFMFCMLFLLTFLSLRFFARIFPSSPNKTKLKKKEY